MYVEGVFLGHVAVDGVFNFPPLPHQPWLSTKEGVEGGIGIDLNMGRAKGSKNKPKVTPNLWQAEGHP